MINWKLVLSGCAMWAGGVYCVLFQNLYLPGVVLVAGGVIILEIFYYRVQDKKKK